MTTNQPDLPPGQHEIEQFPRFGLPRYAKRYRKDLVPLKLELSGRGQKTVLIDAKELARLERVDLRADFHCVTTWTKTSLLWSGYKFADFYRTFVQNQADADVKADMVILKSHDGFRACLPLGDLMADNVLLADCLNGEPLAGKHGAPLRLIAPDHYGYKNIKHLNAIQFESDASGFKPPLFRFMDHPRARVAKEERGRWLPGWFFRLIYRPLIKRTIKNFARPMR